MTDTAPLASIAADLSGGRTSGLRFLDAEGTLAIVSAVTGLAADDRGPLEDKLRAGPLGQPAVRGVRSEDHTAELQSLLRIPYAVFSLENKPYIQPNLPIPTP